MFVAACRSSLFFAVLLFAVPAFAQQNPPAAQPTTDRIQLEVVVSPKSGSPVGGLQQQDFTVLDNNAPRALTSFRAVAGREAPMRVIVVIDAVNAATETVSFARLQVDKFLHAEGGHLAYPTTLAVLTDKGVQLLGDFSTDGNSLSAALNGDTIGLRDIGHSAGYYGATERLQMSLQGLNQLVTAEAPRPGRTVMLWISPGWPLLSGPNTELDSKQQQEVFANIVNVSNELVRGRVTLYNVNPLGTDESVFRATYYEEFLKGVSKPSQANLGNLALPVLAVQSGGLAFNSANDVAKLLQECLAQTVPYYELTFDAPESGQRNEYHHLEIKIAKPGLIARTRQGYYAQPSAHN
jgi:VWFA-related protein